VSLTGHALDGVAVVSDIMASLQPLVATQALSTRIRAFCRTLSSAQSVYNKDDIKAKVGAILDRVKHFGPLIHQVGLPSSVSAIPSLTYRFG
jgi:thiamine-phosphate diphosphorylase / hydroxyethylthiazole kinase